MKNKTLTLTPNSMIKVSIILLAVIYVISPIDVVPDVLPVGWTDNTIATACFILLRIAWRTR